MPLKRVQTADKNTQLIQDYTAQAIAGLDTSPFVGGILLTGIVITSGQDNLIAHQLGRPLTFWVPSRSKTNGTIWEATTSSLADGNGNPQSSNSTFINLKSSATCTVSLWVY